MEERLMGRICGIDLGTTNSLIGHGDELYTGLVSSSVDVSKKAQVSRDVVSKDIVSSYKINMTTGSSGKLPIACSAIILRDLVNKASMRTGEYIEDIVVSVPAKFSHTQRQAVWDAAEQAGLTMHGLINEPTAAALYVCRDLKDLVVVYDLGGGTFDVTILDSRVGNYFVVATDGDGHLAGDNFDRALANKAMTDCKVKMRFRSADSVKVLVSKVRLAKEALQKTGLEQYVDMDIMGVDGAWKLTKEDYVSIMKQIFAPTIKLTKQLIQTNLMESEKPKIVFVGGSTECPYLREWVMEETGLESIPCDVPADLIVAKGVALYAEMVENGTAESEVDDVTKCLCIENSLGMAEVIIEKNTVIPVTEIKVFDNTEDTRYLNVNLYQGDSILCSENEYVGTLVYDYGEVMPAHTGLVEIEITVDRNGRISLSCTNIMTNDTQQIKLVMK
jgi:molecular chaperone DnaK (HSP70)